ncbi:MAG: pyruvate ferredoxin oxidoreductase [Candidatus Fischerbacteria bacterium RBG_13_37_8]|uniref:Pyruvate ferredoxin oxidoreductase n=1 Tax=Candidatus Fischerbacteria bacterium RBG_13_37_8 TaxID=1817863 RepID=A0A1F5V698_9BACT|nr:MAG: pyruvate ferredoxin oxidoreductase [Candidatus Fischerbacteria bacterium RBG_13_37_8]
MVVIEGTHSASYGAMLARAEVIAAYPITPQTGVVEKLSEMCASGELRAKFIKVESEHSAMACCIGASAAGARSFTATSAQGLALMHELLHWAANGRHPVVMANINRAMAPPWTIWADQTDSLSQRDTGWIQFYCESNQEILDTVIQSFKIGEKVLLPCMINMDAFFLSHTSEPVALPQQEALDEWLPPFNPALKLDINEPHTFGGLTRPDAYMELRYKIQEAMDRAYDLIKKVDKEYFELFGRSYGGLVEAYNCEDAEIALVTSGTAVGTARIVVDDFRKRGIPVGLIKVRVIRPFPYKEIRDLLSPMTKVAIVDRNISFGCGGIFSQEIRASLFNYTSKPIIFNFVAGLGGRDITPTVLGDIINYVLTRNTPESDIIWFGLKK